MCNALKKGVWHDMSKSFREDLTGQRFGRLTVIEFVPNDREHSYWKCRCDCKKETIICGRDLKKEHTKSCGCLQREKITKHGGNGTRLYSIWNDMRYRCNNPNVKAFKYYGGRNISVCDEWEKDFATFRDWAMANGYDDTLTIDRIDVNGNYEPSNCRWVDMKTQLRNTRRNIYIEYQEKQVSLAEAAELAGIEYGVIGNRYHRGNTGEKLFRPVSKKKNK